MRSKLKYIYFLLPIFLKKLLLKMYESYFSLICNIKESLDYPTLRAEKKLRPTKIKKNILIYHISGLGFGGTEKSLQFIANLICDEYNVYFLHSTKDGDNRKYFLNDRINVMYFDYKNKDPTYPFYIRKMSPHIKEIINDKNINLIITADSGYTQYPINTIKNIPVLMINIFGSPTIQRNIYSVFISEAVRKYTEKFIEGNKIGPVIHLPISPLALESEALSKAKQIREMFNIKDSDFVFGRIGRNSNDIFDSIGIRAFKEINIGKPEAHYIIMSPPPILEKIVSDENIPNVHFLPPSPDELDIWGFHYSLDALAHFRNDGETFGMNIAESMFAGNPIISHKSHIWNAHLEYLNSSFSRVAEKGDYKTYADYMIEFIELKQGDKLKWLDMKNQSKQAAIKYFSLENFKKEIKNSIRKVI